MLHPAVKITLSVLVIIVTGAVLAPAVFFLGKAYAAWGADNWVQSVPPLEFVRDAADRSGFTRYFNRAILVAAIVWLLPLWRWLAADDPRYQVPMIGFRPLDRRALGHALLGFGLAAGMLAVLGWLLLRGDLFRWSEPPKWNAWTGALTAGVAVALLEEWFFRGLLFAILRRAWSTAKALIFLTLFFALIHFLKPPEGTEIVAADVSWASGFHLLGLIFGSFGDVDFLLAEFAMLTAVGLVLGLAVLRTGTLWLAIGLHAGWVFGLKWFGALTRTTRDLRDGDWLPWMGTNLKIGLWPLAAVALTGVLALLLAGRPRRPGGDHQNP